MEIKKGDKFIAMENFKDIENGCKVIVTKVTDRIVYFTILLNDATPCDWRSYGCDHFTFSNVFKKINDDNERMNTKRQVVTFLNNDKNINSVNVDKRVKVSCEDVDKRMETAEIEVFTVFDKCTVVACKLNNGFVLVESSACIDPDNYDEEIGVNECLCKIENKVWELEGYMLQNKLYEEEYCDCDNCECQDICEYYNDDFVQ